MPEEHTGRARMPEEQIIRKRTLEEQSVRARVPERYTIMLFYPLANASSMGDQQSRLQVLG